MAAMLCGALELCSLVSCVGGSACSLARCCCACGVGGSSSSGSVSHTRMAKAGYLGLLLLSTILALVLYNYGDQATFLTQIPVLSDLCAATRVGDALVSQCYGAAAVLRVSFGSALFFAANAFLTLSESTFVGCWGVKFGVWFTLMCACFFVPADTMAQYATASRVFSILFILAMIILIIDFAYHAQEWLGEVMDAEDTRLSVDYDVGLCQNKWRVVYMAVFALCVTASLGGIIALYYFSANRGPGVSCQQNITFISVTLVAGLTFLVASPLEAFGGRGVVTPSLVFAYCTWLCWSAIDANPYAPCNPTPPDASNTGATVVGMLIAAASLTYTAFAAARSLPTLFHNTLAAKQVDVAAEREAAEEAHQREHDAFDAAHPPSSGLADALSTGLQKTDVEAGGAATYAEGPHHHQASTGAATSGTALLAPGAAAPLSPYTIMDGFLFTFILCLASLYMGQVLTNWVSDPSNLVASRQDPATMWIQIGTQWATLALYAWTLVAPLLCPNRDFS